MLSNKLITIHRLEGLPIPIVSKLPGGEVQDISGHNYSLVIEGAFTVDAIPDPNNPTGLLITITEAQSATLPAERRFALVDKTGDPDRVIWSGIIRAEGFTNG